MASRGGAVVARSASAEAPVDVELLRAEEVRIQMAKAMNATVLRINVPEYKTSPGNWLAVVGSLDELGSWQPSAAARLKWLPGHEWVGDVVLPEHYSGAFEYKVRRAGGAQEEGSRRAAPLRVLADPDADPAPDDPCTTPVRSWCS